MIMKNSQSLFLSTKTELLELVLSTIESSQLSYRVYKRLDGSASFLTAPACTGLAAIPLEPPFRKISSVWSFKIVRNLLVLA